MNMELHTFKNEEDGVSGVVRKHEKGLSVTLRDDDADMVVGFFKIFPPDREDDAIAFAKEVAGVKEEVAA